MTNHFNLQHVQNGANDQLPQQIDYQNGPPVTVCERNLTSGYSDHCQSLLARYDNIVVEGRHLFFPDESSTTGQSLKETPIVYAKDLCSFVTDLLDKYNEQQLLDFHDGNIPDDHIWVKIGGDHVGNSFKLCLQIANVKSPNSKDKTFMITMFNGKDTAENLRRALWHYRHQVYKLKKLKWMGKSIKLLFFSVTVTFSAKYLDHLELQAPIHVYGATQPSVKCKN